MVRKRLIAMGMTLMLAVSMLTGCGQKGGNEADPTPTVAENQQNVAEPTKEPEVTEAPEATPTEEPTPTPVKESEYPIPEITMESFEIPDTEGMQFVKNMKIGWSLGNTFDASDANKENEMDYEMAWCGAKTSEKLIQSVKDAGFNTIRIPVSWHNHVSGDNHTISEQWITRVQEVVDYAIDAGFYVILNIHHDNSTEFMYPTSEYLEQSKHYVKCVWEQVAARFADYDEHLVFETLNEPRMVGTNFEWWLNANDASCKDAVACLNQLNQLALDTIRAAGGNNADRFVMVPGYCASVDGVMNDGFVIPMDTATDRIILSVHAYTPYDFALNEAGTAEFDAEKASDVRGITSFMDRLYDKYIKNGTPVVIGEFGARHKRNTQARVDFAASYIAAARARGITCCWWDNNAFIGNGELFGLVDRLPLKWRYQEVVDALMKYAE